MDYITVAICCLVALIIGICNIIENELFSSRRKKKFIILASVIFFEIVIDTVMIAMDGNTDKPTIYKILKIVEFIIAPFIPTILANLISRNQFWLKIRKYFIILIVINTIANVLTFFEPLMFNISADATYSRTLFTYLYAVILMICMVLLMMSANNTFIQSSTRISYTLAFVSVFLLLGLFIRIFNQKSNADWLCITFSYFIFIMFFCNSYLKIDSLTSLLNRRVFDNKVSQINYSTAFIMIDTNNFKNINDTYGHQSGDRALSKIAEAIFNVYSKYGFCYRIGGDEFCVILRPHVLKKLTYETENCDAYCMLENLMKQLDIELENMSKDYPVLQYGVAQGFGIYYSSAENPSIKDNKSVEEVIKIADKRMYTKKNSQK